MSVPFGVPLDALVATPEGPRPAGDLAVGDSVWAYDTHTGEAVPRAVVAVQDETLDHLVSIDADPTHLRGVTPGTNVYDAFEERFRGAASLSTLSEVVVWDGQGTTTRAVLEVPEHHRPGTAVRHLTLDGDEEGFFADHVLIKQRESR